MRSLIISDIHGDVENLRHVFMHFNMDEIDKILILGDELYHGPRNSIPPHYDCQGVAELLNSYADKIVAARGNCDAEVDQMLLVYPCMDDYQVVELDGFKAVLTHGHLDEERCLPTTADYKLVLCGHTHIPCILEENNTLFVNPGSITFPKADSCKSFGLIEGTKLTLRRVEDNEVYETLEVK